MRRPVLERLTVALLAAAVLTLTFSGQAAAAGPAPSGVRSGSAPPPAGSPPPGAGVGPAGSRSASAVTPGRYVALGDSVPYGHGLANPGSRRRGDLPPDQGPSAAAWPSLVQAALPALAPLRLRPTSCSLGDDTGRPAFDQLSISGAPSIDNASSGGEDSCGRARHRALAPDELEAADLAGDPPALVSIQVGADDIDFAGCLKALLGVPPVPGIGGRTCVTRTADQGPAGLHLTVGAVDELADLQAGLTIAIRRIHAAAPNARIVVVDYYQPIPDASRRVRGSSLICLDLRALSHLRNWRTQVSDEANYVQRRLNGTLRSVALAYPDVTFVDITGLFAGHELCSPDPWVFDSIWDAAHPTAAGQRQIARAVLAALAGGSGS